MQIGYIPPSLLCIVKQKELNYKPLKIISMANKRKPVDTKKIAFDTFRAEYMQDETIFAETETLLTNYDYYIPTQATAKYLFLRLLADPSQNLFA